MKISSQAKAVKASRRRAAKKGLVRVEVLVPKRSASLVRHFAADLRRGSAEGKRAAGNTPQSRLKPGEISLAEAFANDIPDEYFEGVFEDGPRTDVGRDIDF